MKRIVLFLTAIFAFVAFANAQRVYSASSDTLQGNETVNLGVTRSSTSSGILTLQALCTELGGTSDGTLLLQGSVDGTSYVTIIETAGVFTFFPNDTLTITDGAVMTATIKDSPFNYYRWKGAGTASDTTLITPVYTHK